MNQAPTDSPVTVELEEYRDLYFSEAQQQLERIAVALRRLERTHADREALEDAFRAAHTLKGMSATMGYDEMTDAAHGLEDLLQGVRGRVTGATASNLFFLFRALEHVRQTLMQLQARETPKSESAAPAPETSRAPGELSPSVRVGLEQLDQLNDLALRLLASAQQLPESAPDAYRIHLRQLQELLDATRHLRLARLSEVLNRYPRMLYDLARVQGKEIRVLIEGGEVEIGRALLEEVNELLLHLLRNAVAHGIEPIVVRMRADKDPCGTIQIRGWCKDEVFYLEVSDDGRGLNAEQILEAAQAQGFISAEERRTLSKDEAFGLITRPGFSLSHVVTPIMGRGVGMDIVKAKVEAFHGTLDIWSEPGRGTAFTLGLPRLYGPVEVELVRVGMQVYALHAAQVESKLTLTRAKLGRVQSGEIGFPYPIVRVLDLQALLPTVPARTTEPEHCDILILNSPLQVALCVDECLGHALWNKPAPGQVPSVPLLDLDQLLSTI